MILWALLTLLCCLTCIAISIPLIRRYEASEGDRSHLLVYRAQLGEIERDEKAGQINAQEAVVAKAEIQRRILAAAKSFESAPEKSWTPLMQNVLVFGAGLFVALGAVSVYSVIGRPDLTSSSVTPTVPAAPTTAGATVDTVDDKVKALEARMQANPADAKGWRMLGWAYFNTGHYDKSVVAYGKALDLTPDDIEAKSALAEAKVMVAGNRVTPEAQAMFDEVLKVAPKDERARFYHSLALEQAGNAAGALDSWLSLYADAPAEAGWLVDVRSHAEALAKQLGKDVSAQLATKQVAATLPGPDTNPEAAAAIQQMPASDQQAMIKTMVQRLADRLRTSPNDAEGWKRLIHARMILNDPTAAKKAYEDALKAFNGDAATQADLKNAALSEGVGIN
jgi:cytochrome c-type biogenesis protein CcmH